MAHRRQAIIGTLHQSATSCGASRIIDLAAGGCASHLASFANIARWLKYGENELIISPDDEIALRPDVLAATVLDCKEIEADPHVLSSSFPEKSVGPSSPVGAAIPAVFGACCALKIVAALQTRCRNKDTVNLCRGAVNHEGGLYPPVAY